MQAVGACSLHRRADTDPPPPNTFLILLILLIVGPNSKEPHVAKHETGALSGTIKINIKKKKKKEDDDEGDGSYRMIAPTGSPLPEPLPPSRRLASCFLGGGIWGGALHSWSNLQLSPPRSRLLHHTR